MAVCWLVVRNESIQSSPLSIQLTTSPSLTVKLSTAISMDLNYETRWISTEPKTDRLFLFTFLSVKTILKLFLIQKKKWTGESKDFWRQKTYLMMACKEEKRTGMEFRRNQNTCLSDQRIILPTISHEKQLKALPTCRPKSKTTIEHQTRRYLMGHTYHF